MELVAVPEGYGSASARLGLYAACINEGVARLKEGIKCGEPAELMSPLQKADPEVPRHSRGPLLRW